MPHFRPALDERREGLGDLGPVAALVVCLGADEDEAVTVLNRPRAFMQS
jgi:hypothetical protein